MATRKAKGKAKPKAAPAPRKTPAKAADQGAPKGKPAQADRRRPGRPSAYSAELGERICDLLAEGLTLRQVAAQPGMPDKATIIRWLHRHDEFCDQYARACETRTLVMADDVLEIAEDSRNDWVEREVAGIKVKVPDQEHMNRARLRIDARKWLMEKMAPKRFGARVQHANDPENPMPTGYVVVPAKESTPDGTPSAG